MAAVDITASFLIHVNQYLAGGIFIGRSVFGKYFDEGDVEVGTSRGVFSSGLTSSGANAGFENDVDLFVYGLSVRLSTGRAAKLRPYVNFNYFQLEIVNHFERFNMSSKTNGLGVDLGLMIRLSDKLYLNLPEAGIKKLDEVFFMGKDLNLFQARIGLTYNVGRKR